MHSLDVGFGLIVMLVILAVAFDFMNGFHDAANSIATVVSTGVLKPQTAVLFAAFFNIVAIWIFHLKVASTVGKGIVDVSFVDVHVIFGALVGAIAWNLFTWWFGIPSSSSHALIGGIVGAVIGRGGFSHLIGAGIWKTVAFIIISPLLGFVLGAATLIAVSWICRRQSPLRIDGWFRRLQLASAGPFSLCHRRDDAASATGHNSWLLLPPGHAPPGPHLPPLWV